VTGVSAGIAARLGAPAVALSDVAVSFRVGEGGTFRAVDSTSLAVADGEFVAIVGPTGCGKSTLLNVAAGLLAPASGRVEIFGAPLAGLNRQAGYLFQAEALFPWKTALENVAIGLETAGTCRSEARERAQTWLARVGLGQFSARYPHMLSGGQRKRVGLVQVLIRDPKILLMDERSGHSTRRPVRSWATCCSSSGARIARQCSSSPTISRRRSRCRIGW